MTMEGVRPAKELCNLVEYPFEHGILTTYNVSPSTHYIHRLFSDSHLLDTVSAQAKSASLLDIKRRRVKRSRTCLRAADLHPYQQAASAWTSLPPLLVSLIVHHSWTWPTTGVRPLTLFSPFLGASAQSSAVPHGPKATLSRHSFPGTSSSRSTQTQSSTWLP
jgi:hypothetical protein